MGYRVIDEYMRHQFDKFQAYFLIDALVPQSGAPSVRGHPDEDPYRFWRWMFVGIGCVMVAAACWWSISRKQRLQRQTNVQEVSMTSLTTAAASPVEKQLMDQGSA